MNLNLRDCRLAPRGWWCSRTAGHRGPCAARPCWWNLTPFARRYRKAMR